jgi:hypothetical protein
MAKFLIASVRHRTYRAIPRSYSSRRPLRREGFVELLDEPVWLRHRVLRMRAALRFAMKPEVESILRELIADAEARLLALEQRDTQASPQAGPVVGAKAPFLEARAGRSSRRERLPSGVRDPQPGNLD